MTSRRWAPTALWSALVLFLTSVPGKDVPDVGPVWIDKVVHVFLYGTLAFFATRAAAAQWPLRLTSLAPRVVLAISAFAALDELHQLFIPGRDCDIHDWLADTVGAALLCLITAAALARREPTS